MGENNNDLIGESWKTSEGATHTVVGIVEWSEQYMKIRVDWHEASVITTRPAKMVRRHLELLHAQEGG